MALEFDTCPGRYCGRTEVILEGNTTWSECSMCIAGFRTNSLKHCEECSDVPSLYQWMYLGFMAMLPLCLNWIYIFYYHQSWQWNVILQLISALFESGIAAIISLLVIKPKGELRLTSCAVNRLSDWYTMFYNPKIKYTETVFCAQEAVYPLYSIAFIYYLFSLMLMLLFRLVVLFKLTNRSATRKIGMKSFYAAMYFYPLIVLIHAIAAGLIYYSYTYLVIVGALLGLVIYCVRWEAMTPKQILGRDKMQHLFIIACHLVALSYAVIGIGNASSNLPYLGLVPVPFAFFMATERFSYPHHVFAETIGYRS